MAALLGTSWLVGLQRWSQLQPGGYEQLGAEQSGAVHAAAAAGGHGTISALVEVRWIRGLEMEAAFWRGKLSLDPEENAARRRFWYVFSSFFFLHGNSMKFKHLTQFSPLPRPF